MPETWPPSRAKRWSSRPWLPGPMHVIGSAPTVTDSFAEDLLSSSIQSSFCFLRFLPFKVLRVLLSFACSATDISGFLIGKSGFLNWQALPGSPCTERMHRISHPWVLMALLLYQAASCGAQGISSVMRGAGESSGLPRSVRLFFKDVATLLQGESFKLNFSWAARAAGGIMFLPITTQSHDCLSVTPFAHIGRLRGHPCGMRTG